ncbi:MAG TPA: cupredoxin domain-containing protein [Actinomycetota bacterium]
MPLIRSRPRALTATAVLAVALSACANNSGTTAAAGGGSPASGGPAGSSAASGASSSGGRGYGYGGGGSGGGGTQSSGGGASVATIDQANFSFDPSKVSVTSGSTITVDNTTPSTPHTFTIKGSDVDITLDGGLSQDVEIDLAPGTYTFYCRFHESLGMKGTITIT